MGNIQHSPLDKLQFKDHWRSIKVAASLFSFLLARGESTRLDRSINHNSTNMAYELPDACKTSNAMALRGQANRAVHLLRPLTTLSAVPPSWVQHGTERFSHRQHTVYQPQRLTSNILGFEDKFNELSARLHSHQGPFEGDLATSNCLPAADVNLRAGELIEHFQKHVYALINHYVIGQDPPTDINVLIAHLTFLKAVLHDLEHVMSMSIFEDPDTGAFRNFVFMPPALREFYELNHRA